MEMKDRFQFRIWDKKRKVMLYEDSEDLVTEGYYDYEEWWGSPIHFLLKAMTDFFDYGYDKDYVLMQSTGIRDVKGNLIYEGDILKIINGSINGIGLSIKREVKWVNDGWNINQWNFDSTHSYEIIGNVYENKELLEIADEK